jgi:hypothetical protein
MDRNQVIAKIQAMMALRDGSTFDGEAANASAMIDRLCAKYGVNIDEDLQPEVLDELFSQGRHRDYIKWILNAVAAYYDAKLYISNKTDLKVIGTEAQQIVVKIYNDFIVDCMEKEAKKAYQGEQVLAELMGKPAPDRRFLHAFKQAFATQVCTRLRQMKQDENRVHEHAEYTSAIVKGYALRRARSTSTMRGGGGAEAGFSAGDSVSLRKQASGSSQRQLCGV